MIDDSSLEDVTERDPVEETEHRLQRRLDETRLQCLLQDLDTELEDLGELLTLQRENQLPP